MVRSPGADTFISVADAPNLEPSGVIVYSAADDRPPSAPDSPPHPTRIMDATTTDLQDSKGLWFHQNGDVSVGPLRADEIRERLDAGDITPRTLVWRVGMGAWKPAAEIPAFRGEDAPVPGLYESTAVPEATPDSASEAPGLDAAAAVAEPRRPALGWRLRLIGNLLLAAAAGLVLTVGVALLIRSVG
jgi:hypothetical protein